MASDKTNDEQPVTNEVVVDPLEASKAMNGVSGPNPVTEKIAPTIESKETK